MLTVVVGQTFHGSLASAPIDQTPKREKPNITYGPNASVDLLREKRGRVDFPLVVPTVIERSSWTDSSDPARMSFANQALSAEYVVQNAASLEKKVYPVPTEIDQEIARLKLETMGVQIDQLTEEQAKYLASWDEGT